MKRSSITAFVGWLCAVACSFACAQGTFTLKAEPITDADSPLVAIGRQRLEPRGWKPDGLKAGPRRMTGYSTYFTFRVGDRELYLAIESGRTPRVYVDTNLNGDLSDESAAPLLQAGRRSWLGRSRPSRYGPVGVTIPGSRDAVRTSLLLETYSGSDLSVCPAEYRVGTVQVGGRKYHVGVVDCNMDGRYDGVVQLPYSKPSDALAIDWDGNGRFEQGDYTAMEIQPLPKMVAVEDAYYAFRPSGDGLTIHVEKVAPATGTLDVGSAGVELMLMSEHGIRALRTKQAKCEMPVGKYSCWSVTLRRKDSNGVEWTLQSSRELGKLKEFEIREGRVTAFKLASPLRIKTTPRRLTSLFRSYVSIALSITDDANVEYSGGIRKGRYRPSPPRLKILDESGKVLASGRFEFG